MLVVISPAKRLDWGERELPMTTPEFSADALRLAKTARNLSLGDLRGLMSISADLARLNRDRFRAFSAEPTQQTVRPALFAFAGDTYQGLDAAQFSAPDMERADARLRILSGLYGLLRPRDAIQPYRLEMGSRLKTRRGATLYDYWGDQIAKALRAQATAVGADTLVNCASQEYFGAVRVDALGLRVITPVFMEEKTGGPRIVSFFAKRARGAMARYIVQERLENPKDLCGFDIDGYVYRPEMSTPDRPVFCRPPAPGAS